MNKLIHRLILVCLVTGAVLPAATVAQIPDEFTNLKLLPAETTRGEIISIMRDWAGGLGVRCKHCHVGPDNLQGMDFASDEKATKRTARAMLEMSRAINRELLNDLPILEEGERAQVVSCYTCHRGQQKPPRQIQVVLSEVYSDSGIDAAIAEYQRLREEQYGRGRYDFSAGKVTSMAGNLAQAQRPDDALKLLEMNLALHPDSADSHASIGAIHLEAGEKDLARDSFQKALEIDAESWLALRGMEELDKPPTNDE